MITFGQETDSSKTSLTDSLNIFKDYKLNLKAEKNSIQIYMSILNASFNTYYRVNNFKKSVHSKNIDAGYFRKIRSSGSINIYGGLSGGITQLWYDAYDNIVMQEKSESMLFVNGKLFFRLEQLVSTRSLFFIQLGPSYHHALKRKIYYETSTEVFEEKNLGHFYAISGSFGFQFALGRLFDVGVGLANDKSFTGTVRINEAEAKFNNTYILTSVHISF